MNNSNATKELKVINVKRGDWFDDEGNEYESRYFRILEDLGILKFIEKVVSHNRYLVYEYPENINIQEIVELLQTIPDAKRVKDFEQHGWIKSEAVQRGGYWAGNEYVNSIRKGCINWAYFYAENLRQHKRIADDYIKCLQEGPKIIVKAEMLVNG